MGDGAQRCAVVFFFSPGVSGAEDASGQGHEPLLLLLDPSKTRREGAWAQCQYWTSILASSVSVSEINNMKSANLWSWDVVLVVVVHQR
jgi:hypothetical protein